MGYEYSKPEKDRNELDVNNKRDSISLLSSTSSKWFRIYDILFFTSL